jgi:CheY-like chemotaxis protein
MGLLDGRRAERYDFTEEVIIDEQVFTNCLDISATGIFVHTVKPFKVNSIVKITIPAYGLNARALVKHFKPGIGLGLEFQPADQTEAEQIDKIIKNIKLSSKKAPKKMRVLLIDGARQLRTVYKNRLVLDGFSVVEANDGMEAIKKMNSFEIHAVVSELEVKRIELHDLLRMIRDVPNFVHIPIYVIANPTGFDTESWVLEAGANKYLRKSSTSATELSSILNKALNKK